MGLLQSDGLRELELNLNRGDGGDPFPGWYGRTELTGTTTPSTQSYAGQDTGVVVTGISDSGDTMQATLSVSGTKPPPDEGGEGGDLEQLQAAVSALQSQVATLQQAVSQAGAALSDAAGDGLRGGWSRRPLG